MAEPRKSWKCRGDCKLVFDTEPGTECPTCFSSAGFDLTSYCQKHSRDLGSFPCPACEREKPLVDKLSIFVSDRWEDFQRACRRLVSRGKLAWSGVEGGIKDRAALRAQMSLGELMAKEGLGDPVKLARLAEIRNESMSQSPSRAVVAERDGLHVSIAMESMALPEPPSPALAIPHRLALNAAADLVAHNQATRTLKESLGNLPEAERRSLHIGYCLVGAALLLGFSVLRWMLG